MSYFFKKYAIILIALAVVINLVPVNLVYAEDLESQIQELRGKIEKKKKELAKLVAKTAKENISFDNPMDALKDVEKQFLLDKNAPETVKNVNDIKESRYDERREAIFQSFTISARGKYNKNSSQMDVESKVELVKTMPGESEGSGVYSEVVLKEMVILMNYIRAEITNLRREATVAAAEIRHIKSAGNTGDTFKMCQYYTERRKKKSLLDKVKDGYEKGKNTMAQVSEGISAVNELKDTIKDTAQAVVNEAQGSIPLKAEDLVRTGGMI